MCIGNVLRLVLHLVRDICKQEVPSLPDQDGDAADHDGDVAEDVHHLLGEFPPLYSEGYAEEPLFHHSMAGLVFRDAPEDHGAGPVLQWVEG